MERTQQRREPQRFAFALRQLSLPCRPYLPGSLERGLGREVRIYGRAQRRISEGGDCLRPVYKWLTEERLD